MLFHTYIDWTAEECPRAFYVGKGNEARTRNPERNQKHRYVRNTYGHRREIIFSSESERECLDKEIQLIAEHHTYYLDEFASEIACNFTMGGDGSTGWRPSDEQRANIARGVREAYANDPHRSERQSVLMHRLMNDPIHREKVSIGIKNALRNMSLEKRENMLQKRSKVMSGKPSPVRGSKNPRTNLTETQVLAIKCEFIELRASMTKTQACKSLMEKHNLGFNAVYKIVSGATWRHTKVEFEHVDA